MVFNRLNGSNTTTYTYDPASNLATVAYPNGIQATFSYDTQKRLTGQTSRLGDYSYGLGPTGNRTSGSEQSGCTATWNYDGIYRLTSETISGDPTNENGSVAYGLDPVGNRLSTNSTNRHLLRFVQLQRGRPDGRARATTPMETLPLPAGRPTPTTLRTG